MMELHGLPLALGHGRAIVPVYEATVEHGAGTRHWWVTATLQPVYVLVRTDSEADGAGYREERIDVPPHAAANER